MNNNAYWNAYYKQRQGTGVSIPSQFAAFVGSELADAARTVVDVGCGNGRDSLFFARHGFKVIGVDASQEAVRICRREATDLRAEFICGDITDPGLPGRIRGAADDGADLLLYARFFLHAIDEEGEAALLRLAADLCRPGSHFALEFRTTEDREQEKVTAEHYRRFVDPPAFLEAARAQGFEVEYFVEGRGFAKYRKDDAHVARVVLRRAG